MPPGLSGGKRIIAGPLFAKKARPGVGNGDIRKVPACLDKILLKTGDKARRGAAVPGPPEKEMVASMPIDRQWKFIKAHWVKRYACR